MITTLSFYDFDGCLMNTPLPDSGKLIWKEKTGNEYPHIGWWGREESLNSNIFDIKPFYSVLNQLNNDNKKLEISTVLLTSRMINLKPEINNILKKHNIKFDELSLKHDNLDKVTRIKEYLNKYLDVKTINIYDDRDKELKSFVKLKFELRDKCLVNIYRVTNGNIALIESNQKIKNIISEEISIYMKQNFND